ncbi:Ig domain-containing protein [Tahibacter harae]|uniref:Ig domain-containing protein n=1 Tax=Tahibacter harae TaxID=2963937 RepID=A0ABT1QU77_9GAMM|nr:Ig domain-containing protein [Tahibacter harae]MCQ4165827.1 putative Ig domain-containing protein [Tahibacter harae]
MKKTASLLSLGAALLLGAFAGPSQAIINAHDNVPAATLLLPYFEIDTASPAAHSVITIGNRSASEQLAHVTLWSDRGVPTYTFDVRLDGYGVKEISLSDLFRNGTLPNSSAGGFATCAGQLPAAALDATTLTALRNAHTGQASSLPLVGGQCASSSHGDSRARGYATVDVVNACTSLVPGDSGYFVLGGSGIARNDNVLWGEQSTYNTAFGRAQGDALVHIEASSSDTDTDGAGDYTFYARRVGNTGADNRESLPTNWHGRFSLQDVLFDTTVQVWRDPGTVTPFACATPPASLPTNTIFAFDHQEEATGMSTVASFPLATQSVRLSDSSQALVPVSLGFIWYDLQVAGAPNQSFVSNTFTALSGDTAQLPAFAQPRTQAFSPPLSFPACSDGVDNDGDGLIDFPADPGCYAANGPGTTENPQCNDGADNDGDGLIDFPNDPQCPRAYSPIEDTVFACSDGIDNDGDGRIDVGSDPQCNNPTDNTENFGQCDDGIDNDGDGLIDYPADPGCTSASDSSETAPQCSDGVDNDGDGLIDFPADTSCPNANANTEVTLCSDGIDNDGDGLIDFPADTSCPAASANSETTQCSDGTDNDGDGLIDLADPVCGGVASNNAEQTQCSDGFDNDGDGLIDYPADIGCTSLQDTSEVNAPQCSDGIDNNGDGLIDFPNDQTCTSAGDNHEAPDCSDGEDNDLDGLIDFPNDPGCASANDLNELSNALTRACSDGIDNDGDGAIDFPADTGCSSKWDDVEYSPTGTGVAIVINPPTLPAGIAGQAYSVSLTATGGLAPYTFSLNGGTLPPGLTLAADGTISGVPTAVGLYNFSVTATDQNAFTGTRNYAIAINTAFTSVSVPTLSLWSLVTLLGLLSLAGWTALRRF